MSSCALGSDSALRGLAVELRGSWTERRWCERSGEGSSVDDGVAGVRPSQVG